MEHCPFCTAKVVRRTGRDYAVKSMTFFECGTVISEYDAVYQVTTPCQPHEQWVTREAFDELRRMAQVR